MIICCECRKPDDNMMLLLPRPGFVDIRRPCCSNCYLNGGNPANPKLAVYLQQRFEQVEMPDPIPAAIAHVWTDDKYNHHAQGVVRYLHGLAKEDDAPEKLLHAALDVEPKKCSGQFDDGIADGNLTSCSSRAGCGLEGCPSPVDRYARMQEEAKQKRGALETLDLGLPSNHYGDVTGDTGD